jgi:hypothetical protein
MKSILQKKALDREVRDSPFPLPTWVIGDNEKRAPEDYAI